MKKLIVLTAIVCAAISLVSCGKTNSSENVNLANTEVTSSVTTENTEEDETVSSLPDKTTFEKVPDEAVDSFNYMIETTKKIYTDTNGKRLYGYIGVETISNKSCYIFAVYEENDGVHTAVATVGVEPNSLKIYALDEQTQKFALLDVPADSDDESQAAWADVVTDSFAGYLSADNEKSDDVTISTISDETSENLTAVNAQ